MCMWLCEFWIRVFFGAGARRASHPGRQSSETAFAGEHGPQLGKFFVALVVAAVDDELVRCGEVCPGVLLEARCLRGVWESGLWRAVVDEPIERREGFEAREGEPRAFERHVAEIEPHRPRLGDLLHLVEIGRRAVPVADAAAEGGAGEEAAGKKVIGSGSAEAFDGLAKQSASVAGAIARGPGR